MKILSLFLISIFSILATGHLYAATIIVYSTMQNTTGNGHPITKICNNGIKYYGRSFTYSGNGSVRANVTSGQCGLSLARGNRSRDLLTLRANSNCSQRNFNFTTPRNITGSNSTYIVATFPSPAANSVNHCRTE